MTKQTLKTSSTVLMALEFLPARSVLSLEFPTYKVFFFFSLGAERVPSQPAQPENTSCMLCMPMFYSRDFHVWFRGHIARIKETLLTLRVGLI